ncbi:MAG: hypothetical protein ABIH50_00650 [bacterium]
MNTRISGKGRIRWGKNGAVQASQIQIERLPGQGRDISLVERTLDFRIVRLSPAQRKHGLSFSELRQAMRPAEQSIGDTVLILRAGNLPKEILDIVEKAEVFYRMDLKSYCRYVGFSTYLGEAMENRQGFLPISGTVIQNIKYCLEKNGAIDPSRERRKPTKAILLRSSFKNTEKIEAINLAVALICQLGYLKIVEQVGRQTSKFTTEFFASAYAYSFIYRLLNNNAFKSRGEKELLRNKGVAYFQKLQFAWGKVPYPESQLFVIQDENGTEKPASQVELFQFGKLNQITLHQPNQRTAY